MTRPRGRAARFAFDPKVFVAFLDASTSYETSGLPRRRRRFINGAPIDNDVHGRMIRRWRTGTEGITEQSARNFLDHFNMTIDQLFNWARLAGLEPVLRGRLA